MNKTKVIVLLELLLRSLEQISKMNLLELFFNFKIKNYHVMGQFRVIHIFY